MIALLYLWLFWGSSTPQVSPVSAYLVEAGLVEVVAVSYPVDVQVEWLE